MKTIILYINFVLTRIVLNTESLIAMYNVQVLHTATYNDRHIVPVLRA